MVSTYGKIISVNLRHNFIMPVLSTIAIFVVTPLLFNITSLQGRNVARPFEFFLSWMGVMLLTPVFLPEQNKEIRDVIRSKKIDYLKVCGIRVCYSVVILVLFVTLFAGLMLRRESAVTMTCLYGGIGAALLFGSVGLAAAGISDNTTIGYMAAMLYYLANYGLKKKLGGFFLFSMSSGDSERLEWRFFGAMVLTVVAFIWIHRRQKQ